jgi:hypothetical protein
VDICQRLLLRYEELRPYALQFCLLSSFVPYIFITFPATFITVFRRGAEVAQRQETIPPEEFKYTKMMYFVMKQVTQIAQLGGYQTVFRERRVS